MRSLDLFSGIGGMALGLERAGFELAALCEIGPYCQTILKKHWPNIYLHNDVRTLDYIKPGSEPDDWILYDTQNEHEITRGAIDLICGGFPCQPFSVAGNRAGAKDNRHVWPEMLRLIKAIRPTWVLGENVIGFIRMALDDVCLDLENTGYTTQTFVIPACGVGAIHRRERVWILAHTEYTRWDAAAQSGSNAPSVCNNKKGAERAVELEGICPAANVADAARSGLEGHAGDGQVTRKGASPTRFVTASSLSRDWEPCGSPVMPPLCHRNNGVPDRVARLKALGNTVMPQIPELLGRAIIEASK